MAPKFPTTVVIAHAGFHKASAYDDLATHLATFDLKTIVPQLPSAARCVPLDPFAADVAVLHNAIVAELMTSHNVVLYAHGYGGLPGCEALQHMPRPSRSAGIGKFLGIIFVSAFVAEEGQNALEAKDTGALKWFGVALKGPPAEWIEMEQKQDTDAELAYIDNPSKILFNTTTCPLELAKHASHLTSQSLAPFMTPITHAGWLDHPSVYLECTADNALPVAKQQEFCFRLLSQSTEYLGKQELEGADHSPHASMPEALAYKVRMIRDVFYLDAEERRMERRQQKQLELGLEMEGEEVAAEHEWLPASSSTRTSVANGATA